MSERAAEFRDVFTGVKSMVVETREVKGALLVAVVMDQMAGIMIAPHEPPGFRKRMRHFNGYVWFYRPLCPGGDLIEIAYNDWGERVDVHGGISYSRAGTEIGLTGDVYGFDCAHAWSPESKCCQSASAVLDEAQRLYSQLKRMANELC